MSTVTLEDKIQLIYEFNDNSPLFAKTAHMRIEEKDFEQAIEILEQGLKKYPFYPTALIAYALALANIGRKEDALSKLSLACDIIDSPSTKQFYEEKIEKISNALTSVPEPHKKGLADDTLYLQELAKKVEGAKMPKFDETKKYDTDIDGNISNAKIVSETMADILYKQGNLIEALAMYEELIQKSPNKKISLAAKINNINKKLSQ